MLVKKVQGSDMKINRLGAILSYLCVLIAIFCFAIPLIEKTKKTDFLTCLKYGGGIGFVIYGVFNATNLAIFKNYDPVVALVDTTWGVTLFTLSCYIYFIIKKTKTIS
jgi:uncharacterized membrane protein